MAISLTTSWQNLSTAPAEYFRTWTSGYVYNYTARAQARYQVVNGQYQIQMRLSIGTDHGGGWSGTNRYYRLRFLTNPGASGDSTYRQDTHSWMATGPQSYYLYLAGETANPVYKVTTPGTVEAITWHYEVGGSGTTAIDVSKDVVIPAQKPEQPEIKVEQTSATSVEVTYGTMSFCIPNTGTVTLYGGTSPNPTTVLDTYSGEGYTQYGDTGLTTGTTYYYRAKAENAQVSSDYSVEVAITPSGTTEPKYYGSVTDESTRILKMYGSVNSQSKRIDKIYGSVGGQAKRIFQFGLLICYIRGRTLPPLRVGPANPRRRDNRRGKWQSKPDQEW